eukprot:5613078-Pyramimonas_sp.AAC.1
MNKDIYLAAAEDVLVLTRPWELQYRPKEGPSSGVASSTASKWLPRRAFAGRYIYCVGYDLDD